MRSKTTHASGFSQFACKRAGVRGRTKMVQSAKGGMQKWFWETSLSQFSYPYYWLKPVIDDDFGSAALYE